MLSKIVVLSLCIGMVLSATYISFLPPIPKEFQGKHGCYVKEVNDVIPFGKVITPLGQCVRITCGGMIDYATCGIVRSSDPKCHVTDEDLSKPYPDCCPNIKCEEENNIEHSTDNN